MTRCESRLNNCVFVGNEGDAFINFEGDPTLTNCTLAGNSGKGVRTTRGDVDLVNCIVWGNSGQEISIDNGAVFVRYSDIEGGWGGAGNIDADPCFVDTEGLDGIIGTEDDNLRLRPGSHCIDAGDNTAMPADSSDLDNDGDTTEPIPWDLDGRQRLIDDARTTDTGNGAAPIVDVGAYEFLPCDIDGYGYMNFSDFAAFALAWGTKPGDAQWDAGCDRTIPADSRVDTRDLAVVSENWLISTLPPNPATQPNPANRSAVAPTISDSNVYLILDSSLKN